MVEDDARLRRSLARALEHIGHVVDAVGCGLEADAALVAESFDLVVLDLSLPGMDGLDVLRELRSRGSDAAVIVLTARTSLKDRVSGLDIGADDYIAKPFDLTEFEARVRAVLRRRTGKTRKIIKSGRLSFDFDGRRVLVDGAIVDMPKRELDILEALLCRSGRVVPKSDLIEAISSFGEDLSEKAIELYISRLRKRLAGSGHAIRALRGIGYLLDEENQ